MYCTGCVFKGAVVFFFGLAACSNDKPSPPRRKPDSLYTHSAPLPYEDTVSVLARVDSINDLIRQTPRLLRLFAEIPDSSRLIAVKDTSSWPEQATARYGIVLGVDSTPLFHHTVPVSESGDWSVSDTYYFDKSGR